MVLSPYFWAFVLLGPMIYWVLPQRFRLGFFAAVAVVLIAIVDPLSAAILAIAVLTIHAGVSLHARNNQSGSRFLFGAAVAMLLVLIAFKLAILWKEPISKDFGIHVWLPLGISYYSFKAVHFVIEFYRGKVERYSFPLLATYMFIPTAFSAGPIQRYDRFVTEMSPRFEMEHVYYGATRIAFGLIKQFVILGILVKLDIDSAREVQKHASKLATVPLWGYLALYYLTLYLNFSAYTDIAIGTSRFFGFRIMENFNFPILATSIDEFWRRWHMTLTNWCREYVYQPILGLWRNPTIASFSTFIVIGLWHEFSLSRLLWGLMHGGALVAYFSLKRRFGKRGPRRAVAKTRSPRDWLMLAGGWLATQIFVIASMCALVVDGNNLLDVGKLFLRLFFIKL